MCNSLSLSIISRLEFLPVNLVGPPAIAVVSGEGSLSAQQIPAGPNRAILALPMVGEEALTNTSCIDEVGSVEDLGSAASG